MDRGIHPPGIASSAISSHEKAEVSRLIEGGELSNSLECMLELARRNPVDWLSGKGM